MNIVRIICLPILMLKSRDADFKLLYRIGDKYEENKDYLYYGPGHREPGDFETAH